MSSELLGIVELSEASVFQPILARNHIHTVEQLAELDEPTLMRVFDVSRSSKKSFSPQMGICSVGVRQKLLEAALEYVCSAKKLADKERGTASSTAEVCQIVLFFDQTLIPCLL